MAATGDLSVTAGGYFPPLLLVEAMAQLGGIASARQEVRGGVLAALKRVVLPAAVRPDARLTVSARIVGSFGRMVQVEGEVHEHGELLASATITLALGTDEIHQPLV